MATAYVVWGNLWIPLTNSLKGGIPFLALEFLLNDYDSWRKNHLLKLYLYLRTNIYIVLDYYILFIRRTGNIFKLLKSYCSKATTSEYSIGIKWFASAPWIIVRCTYHIKYIPYTTGRKNFVFQWSCAWLTQCGIVIHLNRTSCNITNSPLSSRL